MFGEGTITMRYIKYLVLVCIFFGPQLGFSAENPEIAYTPKEQINFNVSTLKAFDHSGKSITHSVHTDGAVSADHNGSMGNVTVARIGANGNIETFCTTDERAAKAFMAGELGAGQTRAVNAPVGRD